MRHLFFPHAPFGADPWLLFLALAEDRDGKLSCDDKPELCIEFFGRLFRIECLVQSAWGAALCLTTAGASVYSLCLAHEPGTGALATARRGGGAAREAD